MTSIPFGSVEYLEASVTADVSLTMVVAIAITKGSGTHTWLAAGWTGAADTTRTARTTSAFDTGTLTRGQYGLYVKLTDSPEVPIIKAGEVSIS
jgi:hypothetical protein